MTKHLRLRQRIVFKIKHSKTISSLGKFPKNQLTPNGLPAHQIKQNTKDKLSQAKAAVQCSSPLQIMILPMKSRTISYNIDFVNESAHDATYEFSVKGDTLILIGGEGTIGGTYELTKVHDKKADK